MVKSNRLLRSVFADLATSQALAVVCPDHLDRRNPNAATATEDVAALERSESVAPARSHVVAALQRSYRIWNFVAKWCEVDRYPRSAAEAVRPWSPLAPPKAGKLSRSSIGETLTRSATIVRWFGHSRGDLFGLVSLRDRAVFVALALTGWVTAVGAEAPPEALRALFQPSAEFAPQFGAYVSPLRFYDGRPVRTSAEWPARRAEILQYWHGQLGAWPELLARPRLELAEKQDRDGVTQYRIEVEIVAGVTQHGFLLLPPQKFRGPRPAVLVPFYAPEVSVDYDGPRRLQGQAARFFKGGERPVHRDFALQLARRGFVTLAIGTPGDDAYRPELHGVKCQPLSYYAYIAANCHTALAQRSEVDPARIGVMGHSYGGKWAMFASCLYEKFAAAVWSDGGVVFDEKRPAVNYWEPWYLGLDARVKRKPGLVAPANGRTGPYKEIFEGGHDLHELHALMAPRPFLVSGGSEDPPVRWVALNHAVAVNRLLGFEHRVALSSRPVHSPTAESNEQAFRFLEHFLKP